LDSFTQIVLGAAVGEAVAGKKIGNKALLYGAIAGTIPDLDVFIGDLLSVVGALQFHRGFTHSILFALIFAPILGYLMRFIHPRSQANYRDWFLLYFFGFVTHALLDCFTTWGTQLFWPFDYRIAFKSIFVIDPLYTVPLFVCLLWLAFLPRTSKLRNKLNIIGLTVSSLYLCLTLVIKSNVNSVFEESFANNQMEVLRYDTRPAPLSTILWASNAEVSDGYHIGYYGLLDNDQNVNYFFFPKRHDLLKPYAMDSDVQDLIKITNNWYSINPYKQGVVFNDLRFGQRTGWVDENGDFVFSYYIYKNESKVIIEEVEKDFKDGNQIAGALWSRILGEKN